MSKIAAIQMCSSNHVDDNLLYAENAIAMAAKLGAELVVLPENMAIMEKTPDEKRAVFEKESDGRIQTFLSEQAKRHQVWLVGGTIPICGDHAGKARAACLIFNQNGGRVARYDKIHLFDVTLSPDERYCESDLTEAGDQVVVVDTPLGKMGIAVCYDLRFPEQFWMMLDRGADFFVLPTAFTVKTGKAHWDVLTRARAIENGCYFIAACQGGAHANGRKTYGHSTIIGPWGEVIKQLGEHETGVIVADIDLNVLSTVRNAMPIKQHVVILS